MATELDTVDKQILDLLHDEGRATYNDIGEELGITGNTVRRRMDRMREEGIIRKFTVMTDPAKLDYLTVAFGLSTEAGRTDDIAEEIAETDCVYKLWVLSGTHNIIFDARFEDTEHFQSFTHDVLHAVEGIASYESSIVTRSVIDDGSTVLMSDEEDAAEQTVASVED
ncbi:Lrp/AsnC family transcriptional regulator [Halomicroarcula sp. GCM10025709]|uniref:Lrp/AsnC family transcriptional regulator n=1 Tax=Haloarcula TaxID=2237 RepID=UPI0024C32382|nr:Lrp/AsnC family transcriptional regulator [Halomicroarcula sp. YJ-61-S]